MKYLLSLLAFLLFLSVGKSQSKSAPIFDPAAKTVLDKISSELESYSSVEMEFDFEISFAGQQPEVQAGLIIQEGEKYFVDMPVQSIYCDGSSLWINLKNNKEVQLNNAEIAAEGGFMDPTALINMYKTGDFEYAISGEVNEEGKTIQQIEFKPIDSASPYSKLRLSIYKGKNEVKRMIVFSKDGSRYTMNIRKITANKTYPASIFVFDKSKHPGVHVEDLRID